MSGPDDRIRAGLERLVEPADPSGAFDHVARRRRRHRLRRRAGSALLSIAVVGGAIGGFLGLRGVFGPPPGGVAGSDRPTPGPTATRSPEAPQPVPFWEICGDAPFPDCHWVAEILDRAGFAVRHNTRSALVGRKPERVVVTAWATELVPRSGDPVESLPIMGFDCRQPYRPLVKVRGLQICTNQGIHVWRAQERLFWVRAGRSEEDMRFGADDLQTLAEASWLVTLPGRHRKQRGCGSAEAEPSISVIGSSFDHRCIVVPAGTEVRLTFENRDFGVIRQGSPDGPIRYGPVPHNVAISDGDRELFVGEIISGGATIAYGLPALPAGRYRFRCDVHPTTMNGAWVVR